MHLCVNCCFSCLANAPVVLSSTAEDWEIEVRISTKGETDGDKNPQKSPLSGDAVYKELSKINGNINQMSKAAVISKLRELKLNTEGSTEILRKRLKNHYRKQKLTNANLLTVSKLFPYYVIVDFEATCEEVNAPNYPHEIIEFPAVLVDTEKQKVLDHFQAYCRPVLNPTLSDFCVELTGITQDQVESASLFPEVLANFEAWLAKHKLGTKHKYAVVTDGPWDMGRFLYGQCKISEISYPQFGKKWVNIRKVFSNFYRCKRLAPTWDHFHTIVPVEQTNITSQGQQFCLKLMLEHIEMIFEGRPHCGLDDARNIARILLHMVKDGASIQYNERIHLTSRDAKNIQNAANRICHNCDSPERTVMPILSSDQNRTAAQVRREVRKWESRRVKLSDEDTDEENRQVLDT
uniref:Exonuclease domain-containing protein n=1 Tax=Timema genevievae TaxID=629358 RepID=A0A7R9PKV1_TIMGE|nr:unnamed protein product [Timema genevievae]